MELYGRFSSKHKKAVCTTFIVGLVPHMGLVDKKTWRAVSLRKLNEDSYIITDAVESEEKQHVEGDRRKPVAMRTEGVRGQSVSKHPTSLLSISGDTLYINTQQSGSSVKDKCECRTQIRKTKKRSNAGSGHTISSNTPSL